MGGNLSCFFHLYRFRKYVSCGFPTINFCNPGVHYETPCISYMYNALSLSYAPHLRQNGLCQPHCVSSIQLLSHMTNHSEILYDRHIAEGHFVIPVSLTQSVTAKTNAQLGSWERRRRHLRHGSEMMRDIRAWGKKI